MQVKKQKSICTAVGDSASNIVLLQSFVCVIAMRSLPIPKCLVLASDRSTPILGGNRYPINFFMATGMHGIIFHDISPANFAVVPIFPCAFQMWRWIFVSPPIFKFLNSINRVYCRHAWQTTIKEAKYEITVNYFKCNF